MEIRRGLPFTFFPRQYAVPEVWSLLMCFLFLLKRRPIPRLAFELASVRVARLFPFFFFFASLSFIPRHIPSIDCRLSSDHAATLGVFLGHFVGFPLPWAVLAGQDYSSSVSPAVVSFSCCAGGSLGEMFFFLLFTCSHSRVDRLLAVLQCPVARYF